MSKVFQNAVLGQWCPQTLLPTFQTCWVPTKESIGVTKVPPVPPGDPALLVKFCDNHYLLGTWDIEDELQYEHYLREFSSGAFENVEKE